MLGGAPLLLLLRLSAVHGYDGCPNPEEVLCGDICVDKYGDCVCGGAYVHYMVEWCCPSAPCTMADPYHVACPGTRLPLTSPCQAACNYNPEDTSFRSYAPCQDGRQCVREDASARMAAMQDEPFLALLSHITCNPGGCCEAEEERMCTGLFRATTATTIASTTTEKQATTSHNER